jgi:hypothetical protein
MYVVGLWVVIVVVSVAIGAVIAVLYGARVDRVSIALTAIGATVGNTGGLSRETAVGSINGCRAWVIWCRSGLVIRRGQAKGSIVSLCGLVFSISIFIGYIEGAVRRNAPETYFFGERLVLINLVHQRFWKINKFSR